MDLFSGSGLVTSTAGTATIFDALLEGRVFARKACATRSRRAPSPAR